MTTKKVDAKLLEKVLDYILDTEEENYLNFCNEAGLDPYAKNQTKHIYGVARDLAGMDAMVL